MQRKTPANLYVFQTAVTSFTNSLMFVTYAIYYVRALHMTPFQLLLVGTSIELTMLIAQVPTGVMADVWGRKGCIVSGYAVVGVGFILEGTLPLALHDRIGTSIWVAVSVMASEAVRGVGESLLSGSLDAWITDEIGAERIGPVFARATEFAQLTSVAGILFSVLLAIRWLNVPYVVGGGLYLVLASVILAVLTESRQPNIGWNSERSWRELFKTMDESLSSLRTTPIMMVFLILEVFVGAASEGFDRLWEAFLLMTYRFPAFGDVSVVVWFGLLSLVSSTLAWFCTRWLRQRIDLQRMDVVSRFVIGLTLCRMLLLFGFALSQYFSQAILCILGLGITGTLLPPLQSTWLNQHITGSLRATLLSLLGQSNALGQTLGGPIIGWAGSRVSIRAALVLAASLWTPVLGLFLKANRLPQE